MKVQLQTKYKLLQHHNDVLQHIEKTQETLYDVIFPIHAIDHITY